MLDLWSITVISLVSQCLGDKESPTLLLKYEFYYHSFFGHYSGKLGLQAL